MRRREFTLIVLAYFCALAAGLSRMGLTDDDDFYMPAGISYARWLLRPLRFDFGGFSNEAIDQAFTLNHEHPPLAKYIFGLCHEAFAWLIQPIYATRVGTMLFATLAAALLLWLCVTHLPRGARVGIFSILFLLFLPRFYFHSHAATLDVPVAAMYLASAVVFLAAERSRRAIWLAGPVFGLALLTKLNAPFLLLPVAFFVLLTRLVPRPLDRVGLILPRVPLALCAMVVLGPLVFLLGWPWLWHDTVARLNGYFAFHLKHYGIHFLYFGRVFTSDPFAPWHAPFVMMSSTVPVLTSLLALIGGGFALPRAWARVRDRSWDSEAHREGDALLFVLLNAVITISVVAFAGTPIYGGEKLFAPFFPFWCLLAGYGLDRLIAETERFSPGLSKLLHLAPLGGALLLFRFGGYALSSYNGLVNGLRGATVLGFERQYYDVAYLELLDHLNEHAPLETKVHFLPNNWEYVRTYRWWRRDGRLRPDIQVVEQESDADWVILTHERRFARYASDLARHRRDEVLFEGVVDGTPLYSVLRPAR